VWCAWPMPRYVTDRNAQIHLLWALHAPEVHVLGIRPGPYRVPSRGVRYGTSTALQCVPNAVLLPVRHALPRACGVPRRVLPRPHRHRPPTVPRAGDDAGRYVHPRHLVRCHPVLGGRQPCGDSVARVRQHGPGGYGVLLRGTGRRADAGWLVIQLQRSGRVEVRLLERARRPKMDVHASQRQHHGCRSCWRRVWEGSEGGAVDWDRVRGRSLSCMRPPVCVTFTLGVCVLVLRHRCVSLCVCCGCASSSAAPPLVGRVCVGVE
jgi:hypothetical protein